MTSQTSTPPAATHSDALFFHPHEALRVAQQRNRVPVWGRVDGCQLCYYVDDEPLPEQLDNLIHLRTSDMLKTLVETRLRLPKHVVFPKSVPDDMRRHFTHLSAVVMERVHRERQALQQALVTQIAALPRRPIDPRRPMRVLGCASRTTTVMQYCMRSWIEAFRLLGHEVSFVIEADDRESLGSHHILREVLEFRPDVLLNINHVMPQLCPPGCIQAVWWQDAMPALQEHQPLAWRREDLVYTLDPVFRTDLVACGLAPERIRTQHFCLDGAIFAPPAPEAPRRRALVFVGSTYAQDVPWKDPDAVRLVDRLIELLDAGEPVDENRLRELGRQHDFNYWAAMRMMTFCIRDRLLRRICRSGIMPVEVYGYGWDKDPEVAPYYRGPIQNGPPLAELYRATTHALSMHPFIINHERLAQIGACGSIPVIWDCRRWSETPHWEDEAVFFRGLDDLGQALQRTPAPNPRRFQEHFSYQRFAQRIIDDALAAGLSTAESA